MGTNLYDLVHKLWLVLELLFTLSLILEWTFKLKGTFLILQDRLMKCEVQDKSTCPALDCPPEDEIHIQDECCPVCKGKISIR